MGKCFIKGVALILIPCFLSIVVPFEVLAEQVKLNSGTPVVLRLTEEISSKTKNTNDMVNLEVARDVVINGKTVIKAGTPAVGTVTWAEKEGIVGQAGKVSISVDSTKTVDNQKVILRGNVTQGGQEKTAISIVLAVVCCFLFLLMKGKTASLPVGTEVKAYTDMELTVEAS